MRIISGKKRSTTLTVPQGTQIRPTADRTREGLFNILNGKDYKGVMTGCVVADIFAGTGALGLEAWSRGAKQVVFVENNASVIKALNANIRKLGADEDSVVLMADATRKLTWPAPPASLVFADPPWKELQQGRELQQGNDAALLALENMIALGAVADGAVLAIEHDKRNPAQFPATCTHIQTRHWGRSAFTLVSYKK